MNGSKRGAVAAAAALVLALTGCIDTNVKVSVKPDGSGTVEKTIVVSKALVEFMKGMGSGGDSAAVEASLVDEKSLKAQAAGMGSGVAYQSAVKVSTDKGNGYKATYAFKDVTKLKINQNPTNDINLPSMGASGGSSSNTPQEFITFGFAKGSPAVLTVVLPKPSKETEAKAKTAKQQTNTAEAAQMMEAFKPLYENLRIAVSVEVQGRIVETNAAHVKGAVVTFVDVDFGKVLSDDAMFRKLSNNQQSSVAETMELLKSFPGVVFESAPTVRVKFQ